MRTDPFLQTIDVAEMLDELRETLELRRRELEALRGKVAEEENASTRVRELRREYESLKKRMAHLIRERFEIKARLFQAEYEQLLYDELEAHETK